MPIEAQCPSCQKRFAAPEHLAGKQVKCPGCGGTLSVPGPKPAQPAASAKPAAAAKSIPVQCPGCQKRYAAPAGQAGKKMACPGCGTAIPVPRTAPAAATQPAAAAKPAAGTATGTIQVQCRSCQQRYAAPAKVAGKQIKCPGCASPIAVPAVAGATAAATKPAAPAASGPIAIQCGSCKKRYAAPAKLAGKHTACPSCGQMVRVPAAGAPAPQTDPLAAGTPLQDPLGGLGNNPLGGGSGGDDLFDELSDDDLYAPAPLDDDPLGGSSGGTLGGTTLASPAKKKKAKKQWSSGGGGGFSFNIGEIFENINYLNMALILGGGVMMFLGFQEFQLSAASKATPQALTAGQLAANGPGDNIYIRLSDFAPANDEFVYQYEERGGQQRWTVVYVPLVSASAGGRGPAKIILKSNKVRNEIELNTLVSQQTIDGMVINKIASIGGEEKQLLQQGMAGINVDNCHIFDPNRRPDPGIKRFGLTFGGLLLLVIGVGILIRPPF